MLMEPSTSPRRALVTGLPLSMASSSANSSACCSSRSPSFQTRRERSPGEMRDQGPLSKARRAAATAASMSALSPAGTLAMTSSVAGSSTGKVLPLLAATHLPSIRSFRSLAMKAAAADPSIGFLTAMFMSLFLRKMDALYPYDYNASGRHGQGHPRGGAAPVPMSQIDARRGHVVGGWP